ncbi:YdaU family protein [Aliisedimentitalea scapharcae]|uniref:YdaU family protein n=1 Tax=Aliisedimentitalea scapharcae TaxID=1524259 RepID=A0ABZ2XSG8_9RHOB
MNGLPYYKAYPRDFIEGTIGMPFEVKCAYRVVLDLIYMQGGELPDDDRYISGLLGCSIRKWKSIRQTLIDGGKITVSGEFLSNKRAVSELETLSKLQDKKRENASGPRKNNNLAKRQLSHTEPEPEPYKNKDTDVSLSDQKSDPPKSNAENCQTSEAVSAYNIAANHVGWPKVQKLTASRSRSLRARLKECGGIEGWKNALRSAAKSDFLCGRSQNNWTGFCFDWLVKPANFTKLIEGNYDNRPDRSPSPSNGRSNSAHGSLLDGFAACAHSDDAGGGNQASDCEPTFDPGQQTVDLWAGGDPSQPILRVVGSS